jgi:aspartate 1-decarboxylase
MEIQILKSKIHDATVTECDIDYEGSCGISNDILEKANILPYQQIEIYNINNGNRFTTYAIPDERSFTISVNGAAAKLCDVGDKVIIVAYGTVTWEYHLQLTESGYFPTVVTFLDPELTAVNRIAQGKRWYDNGSQVGKLPPRQTWPYPGEVTIESLTHVKETDDIHPSKGVRCKT